MLNQIKSVWKGSCSINDRDFASIPGDFSDFKGQVHIKLYPKGKKPLESSDMKSKASIKDVESTGEIKISVKAYMTRKATPEFDFMAKWNNNNPMPLRTMTGTIEK